MELNEKLRMLRFKKCMLQKDVAEMLGISRQALNQYETGKLRPSQDRVRQLADYYGVPIDYLLQIDVEVPNNTAQLSVEEKLLLDKFNKLPKDGKIQILNMIDFLLYGGAVKSSNPP